MLCSSHNSLFNKDYISFGDNGKILISTSSDESLKIFLNIYNKI
ncbi:hypothetical protein [Bacillus wiedmannii]